MSGFAQEDKEGPSPLFRLSAPIANRRRAYIAGFAFLELGTVRKKNQVNALVKILVDFSVSTVAYFFIGYTMAYGVQFFGSAESLAAHNGYALVRFFYLLTFAAAIPAIVLGGIAERSKFNPQLFATFMLVGFIYPFFEGIVWNGHSGVQNWLTQVFDMPFHDFAGSVVVHAFGGWVALPAVLLLGARNGRYHRDGGIAAHPPSNIPFLALGAWVLTVGWFGFNVMSAQTVDKISGLVAVNSLMAMVGGTLSAWLAGRNDPGFTYNGPLAGLMAVCAGSDGLRALGGMGGVSFGAQLVGTLGGVVVATLGGTLVYGAIRLTVGLRLDQEDEYNGRRRPVDPQDFGDFGVRQRRKTLASSNVAAAR
ncbi:Ammonia channel [Paraburkholderia ultramafica]|uniref:Ammonia channel n=1 Tax=Paraburkholderia ultramafica TaxID=1544867 RepID=A0A6S7BI84_9BURK|nr:Ammonia channel [Paraburkholderia ultramafica]